jgi:hypothetical protein
MYISQETPEETDARLRRVLAGAELVLLPDAYAFVEVEVSGFPVELISDALAFVRDEDVWSALVPATAQDQEQFVVFSFHFPPGVDNSGFVGWLAAHLKSVLGTGVVVVCGQNSNRGGIFDYWGAPLSLANEMVTEIHRLRATGGAANRCPT